MRQESGFTLIELMLGIGLTAIMLSIAVPTLGMFVSNARQTGTLNDFVSSLHIARSTAITTNSRVKVCPSSTGTGCQAVAWDQGWIVFGDTDNDNVVDADETIVARGAGVEGLSMRSSEFSQFLTYRPNGRVMNASINGNSGQFTVCDNRGPDHAKVMIVDLSGRPRTSEYLADGGKPSCGS